MAARQRVTVTGRKAAQSPHSQRKGYKLRLANRERVSFSSSPGTVDCHHLLLSLLDTSLDNGAQPGRCDSQAGRRGHHACGMPDTGNDWLPDVHAARPGAAPLWRSGRGRHDGGRPSAPGGSRGQLQASRAGVAIASRTCCPGARAACASRAASCCCCITPRDGFATGACRSSARTARGTVARHLASVYNQSVLVGR